MLFVLAHGLANERSAFVQLAMLDAAPGHQFRARIDRGRRQRARGDAVGKLREAAWISSSLLRKCRKRVTSLTPAAWAIRRVVAPRNPTSENVRSAASSSESRTSIPPPYPGRRLKASGYFASARRSTRSVR